MRPRWFRRPVSCWPGQRGRWAEVCSLDCCLLSLDLVLADEPEGEGGAAEAEEGAECGYVVEAGEEFFDGGVRDQVVCLGEGGEGLVEVEARPEVLEDRGQRHVH